MTWNNSSSYNDDVDATRRLLASMLLNAKVCVIKNRLHFLKQPLNRQIGILKEALADCEDLFAKKEPPFGTRATRGKYHCTARLDSVALLHRCLKSTATYFLVG